MDTGKLVKFLDENKPDGSRIEFTVGREISGADSGYDWCWQATDDFAWVLYWYSMWDRAWSQGLRSTYRRGMSLAVSAEWTAYDDGFPYQDSIQLTCTIDFAELADFLADPAEYISSDLH